jgi:hypothetical protein
MASFALTGQDVIQINGRIITALADADSFMVTFPNPLTKVKAAKSGNVIYALDQTGLMGDVVLRLLIGSDDDKYLNSLLQTLISDISTFVLMTSNIVKRVGNGQGAQSSVVYQCSGGIFKEQVGAKTSAEGDVESSISIYNMTFGSVLKTIQ